MKGAKEGRDLGLKSCIQAHRAPHSRGGVLCRAERRALPPSTVIGWVGGREGARHEDGAYQKMQVPLKGDQSSTHTCSCHSIPFGYISFLALLPSPLSSHCVDPLISLLLQVPGALSWAIPPLPHSISHLCLEIFRLLPGVEGTAAVWRERGKP